MKMIVFFKYLIFAILFAFLFIVFVFAFKLQNQNLLILDKFNCWDKITIVTKDYVNNESIIENGELNYYTYDKACSREIYDFMKAYKVEGVTFYFSSHITFKYFQNVLDYNLTNTISEENLQVYYGFCEDYSEFVVNNGKKVNVQLAKTSSGWVLGMPLILTGF